MAYKIVQLSKLKHIAGQILQSILELLFYHIHYKIFSIVY